MGWQDAPELTSNAGAASWESAPIVGDDTPNVDQQEKPLGLMYAPLDAALNLGTGMAAQAYGGLKSLGTLATGGTLDQATKDVEEAAQDYTWQPRGKAGEAVAHAMTLPIEYATKGAQWGLGGVGELVGGEKGRDIGELIGGIGVPIAATILGGRAALKAAPGWQTAAQDAFQKAKAQRTMEAQAVKYPESAMQGPKLDAAYKAQEYGISVNPYEVSPTRKNAAVELAAGGDELSSTLSIANEGKWTDLARKDMSLGGKGAITIDELKAKRSDLARPYEELRKVPALLPDDKLLSDISGTSGVEGLTPQAVALIRKDLPDFHREIMAAAEKGFNGADIVELTKRYRESATDGFRAGTTESIAIAKAKRAAADALDNFAERKLVEMDAANPGVGYGRLVSDLKNARAEIAKSHAYQDAIDLNSGKLTPSKIASNTSVDHPYTGILADIGAIAGNFPHAAKVGAELPSLSKGRIYRSGLGGTVGGALGYMVGAPYLGAGLGAVAGAIGGRVMSKRITSPEFQRRLNIQDFRPASERGNFVGPMDGVRPVPPINAPEPTGPLPNIEGAPPLVPGSFGQGMSQRLDEGRQPLPVLPFEGMSGNEIIPPPRSFSVSGALPRLPDEGMPIIPERGGAMQPGGFPVLPEQSIPRQGFGGAEPIPPNPLLGYSEPTFGAGRTPLPKLDEKAFPSTGPAMASELMSIADDLPKGTKMVYENAVDFMSRQDALNQPAMVEATTQFLTKAEDLRGKIHNSQGFWKNRYQAELDALSQEFYKGMIQFGSRTPQEAIGLQPMYEGSGPLYTGPANTPRLQVEKTRSLRDLMQ